MEMEMELKSILYKINGANFIVRGRLWRGRNLNTMNKSNTKSRKLVIDSVLHKRKQHSYRIEAERLQHDYKPVTWGKE